MSFCSARPANILRTIAAVLRAFIYTCAILPVGVTDHDEINTINYITDKFYVL